MGMAREGGGRGALRLWASSPVLGVSFGFSGASDGGISTMRAAAAVAVGERSCCCRGAAGPRGGERRPPPPLLLLLLLPPLLPPLLLMMPELLVPDRPRRRRELLAVLPLEVMVGSSKETGEVRARWRVGLDGVYRGDDAYMYMSAN